MFKRLNRLPAYMWGSEIAGCLFELQGDWRGLPRKMSPLVPLSQRLWVRDGTQSGELREYEDTPCDIQLPWKKLVSNAAIAGLTINGEIYLWPTHPRGLNVDLLDYTSFAAFRKVWSTRRLMRPNTEGIGEPFKDLAWSQSNLSPLVAVTKSGRVFEIPFNQFYGQPSYPMPPAVERTMPGGVKAVRVLPGRFVVGDDGFNYTWGLRFLNGFQADTTNPTRFFGWVRSAEVKSGGSGYSAFGGVAYSELGQVDVTPAPSGGVNAQVAVTIADGQVQSVEITNSGRNYTSPPSITVPGGEGAEIEVRLEDGSEFVHFDNGLICTAGGDAYSIGQFGLSLQSRFSGAVQAWLSPGRNFGIFIDQSGGLYVFGSAFLGNESDEPARIDSNQYVSAAMVASSPAVVAVRADGSMWSWGRNIFGCLGDSTNPAVSRAHPVQIGTGAEWLSVTADNWRSGFEHFVAVRKDSACRSLDQPMEYWPDSYFSG